MTAIGGSGSKRSRYSNTKDFLTGKKILFTEFKNSAAFKSYSILKFGNSVGYIKKYEDIEISDILCQLYQWSNFFPIFLKFALEHPIIQPRIWNSLIFLILKDDRFMLIWHQQITVLPKVALTLVCAIYLRHLR